MSDAKKHIESALRFCIAGEYELDAALRAQAAPDDRIAQLERELAAAKTSMSRCLLGEPPGDCYAAEVVDLRAKLAAAREAAERYRWLRDAAFDGDIEIRRISDDLGLSHLQLDVAIDKARARMRALGTDDE